jgi:histidyl-tRNA synthetase
VFNKIRAVFKKHGAKEIETPVCELKETLTGKYGEDSKLVYDLKDQGGELLSLRYDLTVPFARYLAEHGVDRMRRFHIARVYRRDAAKVNAGRFREFYQCDFDAAGVYEDMVPDAECVKIVSDVLEALEFPKYGVDYEVKINHRALLDGVFELCGVPAEKFRQICSAVDKLDKHPWDQVRAEMLDKGLSGENADLLGRFVSEEVSKRDLDLIERLCNELGNGNATTAREQCALGIASLRKLLNFVNLMKVPMKNVKFDMSMARGLDYYTGVIFEVILRKDGKVYEVGSVAGGGRYDNLVGMFSKKKKQVPCVGISLGIERLITVLDALLANAGAVLPSDLDVYVGAIDAGGFESLPNRMAITAQLWDAGLRAEFAHKRKAGKLNEQFQDCENDRVPIICYFGSSEWKNGIIKVRRMFHDRPRTEEGFIQKQEVDCSVDELVDTIKRLLAL